MGIAQQEANQLYPDEILSTSCMIVDDKSGDRDIYIAGRTADPCEEQVEAGAIALFEKQTNFSKGADHTEEDVRDAWTHMPEINRKRFRELALAVLDAARKTVM